MADTPNNVTALLTALLTPAEALELALQQLYTERALDTAVGAQLDQIGVIVGQTRDGNPDAVYRRYLRARIAVHRSRGTIADVYKVANAVLDDPSETLVVENQGNAALVLLLTGHHIEDSVAEVARKMLRATVSAGVRIIEEIAPDADSDTFFTAAFAPLSGVHSIGATTVTVSSTSDFDPSGSLVLDAGLTTEETVTYTGLTVTSFVGVSALTKNHVDQSAVTQATGPGKGFGDSSDSTAGGQLAIAQD